VKNKEKTKSTLIKDAIALFLITLISGLALSFVYEVTKAPIDEQKIIKKEKANKAVFAEAESFETDDVLEGLTADTDLTTLSPDYKGITVDEVSKALDGSGNIIGYDVTVTTAQSYKDSITLVFGYSKEGVIEGIQIMSISETAGLGMNATKPAFLDQYLNKNVDKFTVTKTGSTSDDQIDALSGATITSRAVTNAVNAGIDFVKEFTSDMGGGQ
jgi:electron transport complex protein RnfG